MKIENVKPCPFCGEQVEIEPPEYTPHFAVLHDLKSECINKMPIILVKARTMEEAIEIWNRRADDAHT